MKLNQWIAPLTLLCTLSFSVQADNHRVPAEWEPHAATWMQWPSEFEANMRPAFADIIKVVSQHEPMHLLVNSDDDAQSAKNFLDQRGLNPAAIQWHITPIDNAWMRDNGPIYVKRNEETRVQNWSFDAWGGNFGKEVGYENDDQIPNTVAEYLELLTEQRESYILEKGNIEVNGEGLLVINWDCQDDRNPGMSQEEHEAILKEALGVNTILWAYGHDPEDGTTGHIDGIARLADKDTLVIADWTPDNRSHIETDLAVDAKALGLNVIWYEGDVNWLVGNGFVAAMADDDPSHTQILKTQLESLFPNRAIYMINAKSISEGGGGGIHCVTNDQPVQ